METEIVFGAQGRIEAEIWHTGIGTRFKLYNCNDNSFSFGFSEDPPTQGPGKNTYTELFLNDLLQGKGSVSQGRGKINIKTVGNRLRIKCTSVCVGDRYKVVAFFDKEQLSILINYLTNYVNTLPQSIREKTALFERDCWAFYDEEA